MVGALESFDEEEMSSCGADTYLKKPFDSELLLQEVQRLTTGSELTLEVSAETSPEVEDRPVEAGPDPIPAPIPPALPRVRVGSQDPFQIEPHRQEVLDAPAEAASESTSEVSAVAATLPEQALEEIAQRVVERLSDEAVREIAWELVPDLAEVVIRDRLQELESEIE
jgi:DNA-binding response OmpR family regulator